MSTRTTETTVTFRKAFRLAGFDDSLPPGTYLVVTDEDEIPGVSVLAYRRTATMLHTPAVSVAKGPRQSYVVDPAALESALAQDLEAGSAG